MDPLALAWTSAGALLVSLGVVDVSFAILHADRQGPVSRWADVSLWIVLLALARRWRRGRREILALAGPLMMAITILVWVGLLVVGFALLAWPRLETSYVLPPGSGPATFLDALYFSGVTFTTLGYGDLVPASAGARAMAVVEAGSGFAVMTAAITYLLTLFRAVEERNAAALRVLSETGWTGRGARFLSRTLRHEGPEGLQRRLEAWGEFLRALHERIHRFPLLVFYYRTRSRVHDPEPMLAAMMEATLEAGLLAQTPGMERVRLAAEHAEIALTQTLRAIARHHARREVREALDRPRPGEAERLALGEAWARLGEELGASPVPLAPDDERRLLELAFRSRVFLDELDRLTGWRQARAEESGGRLAAQEPTER